MQAKVNRFIFKFSLVFAQPPICDHGAKYGHEVAEAVEGVVDDGGRVLVIE